MPSVARGSVGSQYDPGMLVDADDVEKCRDQAVHVAELQMAALGLAQGDPVQNAAGRRKIDTNQVGAGNYQAVPVLTRVFKPLQRLGCFSQDFSRQFHHRGRDSLEAHRNRQALEILVALLGRQFRCLGNFVVRR